MPVPILKQKLKLSASEYYVLEAQVFDSLKRGELSLPFIKSIISKAQYKYFILKIAGYNFNQIAIKINVDASAVVQACKRAVIFITEYLNKHNKRVA